MALGEILDTAFKVFRDRFPLLLGIGLVVQVPFAFLLWVMTAAAASSVSGAGGAAVMLLSFFVWLAVALIATPLCNAATTKAIADAYLSEPASIGRSYGHAMRLFGPLFGALLLYGLLVTLGFFLLILPGILLMLSYAFWAQVVMVERLGGMAALRRSGALARGRKGRVFAIFLLLGLLGYLAGIALGFAGLTGLTGVVALMLLRTLIGAFGSAVWTVAYFEARCTAEGFDLQRLADSLGSTTAAPALAPARED